MLIYFLLLIKKSIVKFLFMFEKTFISNLINFSSVVESMF
jgi:hypothetical protein